jgi:hypothetical protein
MAKKKQEKVNIAQTIVQEIDAVMTEKDPEKSKLLWEKVKTGDLISYTDLTILDMEVKLAKIKLVNFILKGRIIIPK